MAEKRRTDEQTTRIWIANALVSLHKTSSTRGTEGKRLKAAWNLPCLLKLLGI
jgi:hypothetical protein